MANAISMPVAKRRMPRVKKITKPVEAILFISSLSLFAFAPAIYFTIAVPNPRSTTVLIPQNDIINIQMPKICSPK
jgi:hypothetical protein